MSAKEIARVQTLMNAVFLKIDASDVATLAADHDVISIRTAMAIRQMLLTL